MEGVSDNDSDMDVTNNEEDSIGDDDGDMEIVDDEDEY